MKYLKKIGLILSAIILGVSAMAVNAEAQRGFRRPFRRPIIIRPQLFNPHPFWGWGRRYDPYWNDPYYWEERQRYYDRKSVSDARNKLAKDREKFNSDGYLTAKEQEKLAKDREKYNKALERLRRDS